MIYTLIHERDPIPCRTTYIEYRSPSENIHQFFEEHHPIPLVFIAKYLFFSHSSTTPVVGGTLRWAWKTHFFKEIGHFGWPVFLLKRCSLGTSDIQGCYSPKGITYMIYTLIHERDPIPCRTTHIEYRSPVKIFINFLRITTEFHWFSLQNSFFHSSMTPVVGYPSVSLKSSFFKYNIKRNWSFRGARFFVEMF